MRLLLAAVLLLALLAVGCGGGSSGEATTAPPLESVYSEGLAAYEQAVADDARPGGAVLPDGLRADGTELAARVAAETPAATYPSPHAPDGTWTARELLEWIAANGRPQAARAAQEAIGSLP